jgi:hypothetical protein
VTIQREEVSGLVAAGHIHIISHIVKL